MKYCKDGKPLVDLGPAARRKLALLIIRAWHSGTAGYSADVVNTIWEWIDGGMTAAIPWIDNPFFEEWANSQGLKKIETRDGNYVGYEIKFTASTAVDLPPSAIVASSTNNIVIYNAQRST